MSDEDENETLYDGSENTINLDEEADRLAENTGGSNDYNRVYAYLPEGKTKVRLTGQPEKDEYEGDPQVKLPVEAVNGELKYRNEEDNEETVTQDQEAVLTFRRGKTENSTWGRIVQVAQEENGGTFEDLEFTVLRSGTGTKTDYTILEYVELQEDDE